MPNHALLTVREAAEKLGISTFRVYRRIQRGNLKAVESRVGTTHFLIDPADLQDYIDGGGVEQLNPPKPSTPEKSITTGEAARRTGFSIETIRDMCYSGQLPYTRGAGPQGRLHVNASAVDALIA